MYRPLQIAISAQSCRLSKQQRKVLVHDILLSVCMCIRICTSAKGPAFLRGELDPQGSIFTPPFRSIPQSLPSWTGCLAGQIKQRLVFLIHNRKVRVTCIIPQRVPKQIQLLPANRRTCHFFPVVSRIRYRWDRCAKVVSADRVAGFSYPDLCAWFCLSDDSTDVVDGFPEYRFGSGDFGVLEVRVAVGANEVGCFDYLFFLIIYKFKSQEGTKEINRCQKKKKKKKRNLTAAFSGRTHVVHVSTCPTHMASAPSEASNVFTSFICPARKSPVVSFLYKSSLPTDTATNQWRPYCFTAANSAAFSALKWSAFCVHTPARIFTPVAKDAGTACTSVSQSEDA